MTHPSPRKRQTPVTRNAAHTEGHSSRSIDLSIACRNACAILTPPAAALSSRRAYKSPMITLVPLSRSFQRFVTTDPVPATRNARAMHTAPSGRTIRQRTTGAVGGERALALVASLGAGDFGVPAEPFEDFPAQRHSMITPGRSGRQR